MFIQTESTPNPATLKFLPGRDVLGQGIADFPTRESAAKSPLAQRLFEIEGVSGVMFGSDFVTVTKTGSDWPQLKPMILGAIMEHFTQGLPVIEGETQSFLRESTTLRTRSSSDQNCWRISALPWRKTAATSCSAALSKSGTVFLNAGSCAGCPSSTATLKNGIENMLRHYIPEVNTVEAVSA
jgi:hypothetical protein